jgi:predicted dehydrogenase
VRIGIVGLGTAARSLHLPALKGIPSAEIVGGVDPIAASRESAASEFGMKVFDDFDRMIAEAEPDAVIVATPPNTHFEYAMRVLDSGRHLISEKPFTSTLAEADKILARAGDDLRVAVNHEFRRMPIFHAVQRADAGDIRFAQVWQLTNLPPWEEKGWRSEMPGRSFYEGGIHLVDYAMFLFGEKPVSVSATVSGAGQRDATDAVTVATLEFSRGRLAQVIQDRVCPGDTQYFETRVDCESGSLRASFGGRARISAGLHRSTRPHVRLEMGASGLAWKETGHRRSTIARNPGNAPMVATRLLLEETIAAFENGSEAPASGAAGRDVLEVLAASYLSASRGQRIVLDADMRTQLASMSLGEIEAGLPEAS